MISFLGAFVSRFFFGYTWQTFISFLSLLRSKLNYAKNLSARLLVKLVNMLMSKCATSF